MTKKEKELIRLYGEFLTHFEFVCSKLRFGISHLIYPDYDSTKQNLCEILTEGLTADPLRKKFIGLIIERHTKHSDIFKSASLISKIFLDVIELRNSFAHGTPFFGRHDFIQETQKARLVLKHPKIKSDGLDYNFKIYDSNLLKDIIDCLQKLESSILLVIVQLKHANMKPESKKKFNDKIQADLKAISIKKLLTSHSA